MEREFFFFFHYFDRILKIPILQNPLPSLTTPHPPNPPPAPAQETATPSLGHRHPSPLYCTAPYLFRDPNQNREGGAPVVVLSGETETASSVGSGTMVGPEVSHLGWGRWYTLRELKVATNGLREENVIGEGGYGIVYSGLFADGTRVAVKNLLNNRSYSLMALL